MILILNEHMLQGSVGSLISVVVSVKYRGSGTDVVSKEEFGTILPTPVYISSSQTLKLTLKVEAT